MTAVLRAALPLLLAAGAAAPVTAADGPDLHAYWDDRCAGCHGDAGPFARATLRVVDGRLAGPHHGTAVDDFLRTHHLTPAFHGPVIAMLAAQVQTRPVYAARCARCHGPAASLVRQALRWDGREWVGREGGQPLQRLLARHGGVPEADVPVLAGTLRRVATEVGLATGAIAP
ncbi:hypothetical protein [Ideonella sp.]|uniref:hypothetical protein n=1 Tax=Ideonella sp. TaxID=1929293 RepID=UPI0035AF0DB1